MVDHYNYNICRDVLDRRGITVYIISTTTKGQCVLEFCLLVSVALSEIQNQDSRRRKTILVGATKMESGSTRRMRRRHLSGTKRQRKKDKWRRKTILVGATKMESGSTRRMRMKQRSGIDARWHTHIDARWNTPVNKIVSLLGLTL